MKLTVKTLMGRQFEIRVQSSDTVSSRPFSMSKISRRRVEKRRFLTLIASDPQFRIVVLLVFDMTSESCREENFGLVMKLFKFVDYTYECACFW